ncbi:MAG: M1 family metallopeptidase [Flavobacteriales bacterium]|nr:M1 family metallopeptidase [Flavobacteriales bacterium]
MKRYFAFLYGILMINSFIKVHALTYPYDTRSDSVDILHYEIRLDISDFTNKIIQGFTSLHVKSKINGLTQLVLDLKGMTVDSIKIGTSHCIYSRTGEKLYIELGSNYQTDDEFILIVYYHGVPYFDSDFGGFYFSGNYAYNVGVSLSEIPHNYGRTWFPCLDNFITRSTYSLYITTTINRKAICGGILQSITPASPGKHTWHWEVSKKIPTYLISVAVSDYELLETNYTSINTNQIPVILAARAADTTKLKNSFVNLDEAFQIYEDKFGPFRWDRLGYVLVPMTAGAMEHAMNIAYPIALANNTITYQDVMAHELAHNWWGNLVTCRTAEDMWINEGSAVYCEYIFNENLYGTANYKSLVRNAHKKNLHMAHIEDQGYWPISGIPQEFTYGYTTYSKGADILHTLRGYMGDSLFFTGLNSILNHFAYQDIDAWEYRDEISSVTGFNLNNFFIDWVFQGGWPWFGIDSIQTISGSNPYLVKIYGRQKLTGRANYSHDVPVEVTFYDNAWNKETQTLMFNGNLDTFQISLPFIPVYAEVDPNEKISHAVTAETKIIKTIGGNNLTHANLNVNVISIQDSVLLRVEQHWTAADQQYVPAGSGWLVNPQRYWKIDGIWSSGFEATGSFTYNGKTSGNNAFLDHLLIGPTEDSLILVYRPHSGAIWQEWPNYIKNTGSITDKVGTITIQNMQKGEYALAYKGLTIHIEENMFSPFKVYPNPSSEIWNITWDINQVGELSGWQLTDVNGKFIAGNTGKLQPPLMIQNSNFPVGTYYLSLIKNGKILCGLVVFKNL